MVDKVQTIHNNIDWSNEREIRLWAEQLTKQKWIEVGSGKGSAPIFENTWANYSATYSTAAFWKDIWGTVHLKGSLADASFSSGNTAFTLPVGYRPKGLTHFPTIISGAVAGGYIIVNTDGTVDIYGPAGAGTFTCIDGISFSTR